MGWAEGLQAPPHSLSISALEATPKITCFSYDMQLLGPCFQISLSLILFKGTVLFAETLAAS